MGPRKRVIKKPETPQTPFIYHKEHHEIVKELNKKHIENLKTENAIYDEEKELEGLRFAEERLIKQRLSDLDLFEQKIIKKSKKVVNRNKLVKVLKSLKQPKQLLHDDNCKKYQMKHVAWSSPTYIIRHIRSSLLNHDWPNLTNLLLLLLNHKRRYFSYINEVSEKCLYNK